MAKITLLNNEVAELDSNQSAIVVAAGRPFKDKKELQQFLKQNADLTTGYRRPSRFQAMVMMQQRLSGQAPA